MKLNIQYMIIGVVTVGLLFVGMIYVSGGRIDIPGISSWRCEVTISMMHGWDGHTTISTSGDPDVYKGMEIYSVGAFISSKTRQIELTSYRGGIVIDRTSAPITVQWGDTKTVVRGVGLGDNNWGRIRIRSLYSDGRIDDEIWVDV